MADGGNTGLLGRLAVHKKMITMEQLVEATAEQGRFGNEGKRLGEILVDKGFLTPEKLDELLALQRSFMAELKSHAEDKPAEPPAANAPAQDPFATRPPPPATTTPPSPTSDPRALSLDPEPAAPATDAPPFPTTPPPAAPPEAAPPVSPPAQPAPSTAASPPTPAASTLPSLRELSEPAGPSRELDAALTHAARMGASDVHLHPGVPLKVRLHGALNDFGNETVDGGFIEKVVLAALNPAQRTLLDTHGQVDFAHTVFGTGRFRANVYRGSTGLHAVFRYVPGFVPSLMQLGLPNELSRVTTFHQGMVLVTGPAGCGKSTTLASLVNIINEERNDHVLTIEDPIEYLHASRRCLVNQRQVSRHTESFARALRAALREDPDVIVIGELRDLETISLAITAAETGHLVLGTLHTGSAIRTINRLVGAFPPEEQPQVRTMISESLRAIISQRLVPRSDGQGRAVALEMLSVNKAVSNVIREGRTFQLRSTLQTGRTQGQLLLDASLAELVKSGVVSREEALRHAVDSRLIG